jgi:hypothetical protein
MRLTSDKKVSDMSMIELAHNSCYADDERNARYRDYEMDMDARDFARNLMVTLAKDEMPISDTEFDEEILDNLAIDPFSDVRGLIALFYRNLWAMADLRETLKKYEDLEEQGLPLRWIPCSEQIPEEPEENPLFDGKCLEVYLVTTKYGSSEQDKVYPFRAFWNGINFTDGMNILDVIAWMPLPKPYRESEE